MLPLLFSPLGRYVTIGLIIAALFGGYTLKQRHDAVIAERARVEQENQDAIQKANEARERLPVDCERSTDCGLPDHFRE